MEETKQIYLNKKIIYIQNKGSRIYYFDYLRIICAFGITLIHVSAKYYYRLDVNSYKWKIAYYYNGFSRFSLPNFFMISGALFLSRDLSFKIIFNKYIKRLFIHLLVWSIIYTIINANFSKINIKTIFFQIIQGYYHLWYLFAIIGIYCIIPFSREIAKNKKLLESFIILYFIVLFVIPNYIYILSYYSVETFSILNKLSWRFNLNTFSINNFYFIVGYYLNSKKEIKKKFRIIIYLIGLYGFFFTTIISYNFAFIKNKKINHFDHNFMNIFLISISTFVFFKSNFNNLKINKIKNNIIQKIAKFTFGIYLIHPLIIEKIIIKFNFLNLHINIMLLIPIINLFLFVLSLIICIFLNMLPIIGKYLV